MTDAELQQVLLESYNNDVSDELHKHFEDVHARWDWCEIGDEACRMYTEATGITIDDFSFLYGLFNAVAAQAAHGAYAATSAALGLDARELRIATADWYENKDTPPSPVTFTKLKQIMAKRTKEEDAEAALYA